MVELLNLPIRRRARETLIFEMHGEMYVFFLKKIDFEAVIDQNRSRKLPTRVAKSALDQNRLILDVQLL